MMIFMRTLVVRCPVCKKRLNEPTPIRKNGKESSIIYVQKHAEIGNIITKYKCTNVDGHVTPIQMTKGPQWYHVYFEHPILFQERSYRYEHMQLLTYEDVVTRLSPLLAFTENIPTEPTPEIILEIRKLESDDPIRQYLEVHYPQILIDQSKALEVKTTRKIFKLKVLLLYLTGCSQNLIAHLLSKNSRGTIATILKAIKKEMGIKDFSLNQSIKYLEKNDKVIFTDYYDKEDMSDFKILNRVLFEPHSRYKHLHKWNRMQK